MKILASVVATVLVAYLLSASLTLRFNPEVKFWGEVMDRRDSEIGELRMRKPGQPVIFFTGGSSTAFSIDPAIIEEACGIPAFNLGLPIAAGAPYLLHQALSRCQRGDVLVVCLEADILAYADEMRASTFSLAMATREGEPGGAAGGETLGRRLEVREVFTLPRPGPRYLLTLIARVATGKGYRYTMSDYRYRGRIETQTSDPDLLPLVQPVERSLDPKAAALLRRLRQSAEAKGVRLVYSMPWRYTTEETAAQWREANERFLLTVAKEIPVLNDPTRGVGTEREYFSDSPQHLTAFGSNSRTIPLATALAAHLAEAIQTDGNSENRR